jgi:Domain of unknown function (DUF4389)
LTTDLEPATPSHPDPAVRVRVVEDLQRSRLTVFFRLLLAIPHLVWLALWTIAALLVSIVAGVIVLITTQLPNGLHRFITAYIRYAVHVNAYLSVAANPFPGFTGAPGYDIDVEFDPPARQNRWKTLFRWALAIPALLLAAALGSGLDFDYSNTNQTYGLALGVLSVCAVLAWFYSLANARAPEGVARLAWYSLHYCAQVGAYALFVSDRYPTSDPERVGVPWPAPPHPVRLTHEPDDGTRSRLTVFFRLLLAIPHLVWLVLWGIAVFFVAIVNWFATLFRGSSPEALHGFLATYVRYQTHVFAYVTLAADPYPGFVGDEQSYPVDLVIAEPQPQERGEVGIRLIIAIPAFLLNQALSTAAFVAAVLGWFAALFTRRMPDGLRRLILFGLRYNAQTNAYGLALLTERYPYAGPPAEVMPEGEDDPGFWPERDEPSPSGPGTPGFAGDDPRGDWVDSPFRPGAG